MTFIFSRPAPEREPTAGNHFSTPSKPEFIHYFGNKDAKDTKTGLRCATPSARGPIQGAHQTWFALSADDPVAKPTGFNFTPYKPECKLESKPNAGLLPQQSRATAGAPNIVGVEDGSQPPASFDSRSIKLSSSVLPSHDKLQLPVRTMAGLNESESERATMVNSSSSSVSPGSSTLDAHLQLLSGSTIAPETSDSATTPIFTEDVRVSRGDAAAGGFTQYGLLGGHVGRLSRAPAGAPASSDPRIYYNVAAPSSTFICGSQGSGKSHTLSCLLENCLIPSVANVLPRPLCGIVFHHDTFISDTGGSPCEAAYLSSSPSIKVRVVCAPTNIGQIKRIYGHLPNVTIQELRLNQSDLNTKRMLDLMAVSSVQGGGMPLYLHIVVRVLRDLRIRQQKTPGAQFDYGAFKRELTEANLTKDQMAPLQQRLDTLESFMLDAQASAAVMSQRPGAAPSAQVKPTANNQQATNWALGPARLTIVDLSCPCVTAEMACLLFNVCLGLFLEQDSSVGRVIALDEAHKYMTESSEAMTLTDSLLSTIRLQRHLGARIIISTQEPTISPRLLDLCSVTIVHRFSSPNWLDSLKKHLAAASRYKLAADDDEKTQQGDSMAMSFPVSDISAHLFTEINKLQTGEALLFSPTALVGVDSVPKEYSVEPEFSDSVEEQPKPPASSASSRIDVVADTPAGPVIPLANNLLKLRIRARITVDGGRSVMAA